jgi:K+-sensing histidine kinase KdpD
VRHHELSGHAGLQVAHLRRLHTEAAKGRRQFERGRFVAVGRGEPHRRILTARQIRRRVKLEDEGVQYRNNNIKERDLPD